MDVDVAVRGMSRVQATGAKGEMDELDAASE